MNNHEWLNDYLLDLVNMTQTDEYAGEKEHRIATTKQAITAKLDSIVRQAEINALNQLKTDYINHTLTEHPKDWVPIGNFIDNVTATMK